MLYHHTAVKYILQADVSYDKRNHNNTFLIGDTT